MLVNSARILVVDDNPATRYSTSHVLRSVGWTILEAGSGTEAIAKVQEEVQLVILDVNLPDFDGFEVCRRIRANDKLARLPVIHLSATFVKDVDKVHGLEVGADGYLVHPVEPPVLIATVQAFLRAREAEDDRERLLISERAARNEAERANQLKDDFLATLSHELRTPLHAIIGWTQVLKLGKLPDNELAQAIDAIERNAQAQAQLISDLLDVSRITSGKLRLDVQPVDPAATIEAAITAILPAAEAKEIRVSRMLDPSAGPVQGDPSRLQQVVWNLMTNAVKFTPKGGKIQVSLERINSHIEIAICDSGQGMDPALLPRIFDRFLQGDASTTREHGGLGLGLAITKQLVEMHGGTIRAESDGAGQGAKFVVKLPLSLSHRLPARFIPPEPFVVTEANFDESVRLDDIRILVVDDDADSRTMVAKILTSCGAITKEAASVTDAIELADAFKPQVLVSDLGMPGEDGFELIRRIRSKGFDFQNLPAIAVTGFARAEDRRRALMAGYQLHMSKPLDPRDLTVAIASLLGRTGQ